MLSYSTAKRLGLIFAILGDLIISIGVIRLRSGRIVDTNVPFFTLNFAVVGVLAVFLAFLAVWVVRAGWTQRFLKPMTWPVRLIVILGCLLIIRLAFAVMMTAIPEAVTYSAPLYTWLLFFGLALFTTFIVSRDEGLVSWHETGYGRWFTRNQNKLTRIATLIVINIIAPVLVLEVGLRVWFTYFGTEDERIIYTYSAEDISRAATQYKGIPYLNYGLSPDYFRHNSLGYRGSEITMPKPAGVFRIVAIGGSTTYNGNVAEPETYPRQLETILRTEYGYTNVEVVNAGTPGYTTWENLVNFEFRVLDLQPDMIILFEGVNDIGPRVYPAEVYTGLSPSAGLWRTSAPDISPSVLYRFIAYNLGLMQNPRSLRSQMIPQFPALDCCEQLPPEIAAERLKENPPIYYERNLRSMVAIAQANNVQVLMSTWVYFPDETSIPGLNSMVAVYRQEAIAEHNDVVRKVSADMHVPLYDLAETLPYNPDYWTGDGIHMAEPGLLEQATEYAAFMVEQNLIPAPSS